MTAVGGDKVLDLARGRVLEPAATDKDFGDLVAGGVGFGPGSRGEFGRHDDGGCGGCVADEVQGGKEWEFRGGRIGIEWRGRLGVSITGY